MNKSAITNGIALTLVVLGFALGNELVLTVGLFALSGAVTNWLAVHMLFEKVPGLYGSGVVTRKFDELKTALKSIIMTQFLAKERLADFMATSSQSPDVAALSTEVIDAIDMDKGFDALVEVVAQSQFGSMLGMFGGVEALEPMRAPFAEKMSMQLKDLAQSPQVAEVIKDKLAGGSSLEQVHQHLENMVDARLMALTPELVKAMMQDLIKAHLGWLVVWGGVFGGLFGLLATFI